MKRHIVTPEDARELQKLLDATTAPYRVSWSPADVRAALGLVRRHAPSTVAYHARSLRLAARRIG